MKKENLLVAALLCMAIAIAAASFTTVSAQQPQPLPDEFRGAVTINGEPAPVGTCITAKIDGIERGDITTTEPGKYGGQGTFDERLIVQGYENEAGHTITFWIDGNEANETATFSGLGESKVLDISIRITTAAGSGTSNGGGSDGGVSNGGISPSPTPELTPTPTATATPSPKPTSKITPTTTSPAETEAETETIPPSPTTTTPPTKEKNVFHKPKIPGFEAIFALVAVAVALVVVYSQVRVRRRDKR